MNRIEAQANYFKNIPLMDRSIRAVAHLEDKEDIEFWENQLQNISHGNYHFITHSRSEKGKEATGCDQCLKYIPYTNSKFFICIDSDLRLLRGVKGLTPENFVGQTHAYSWENHNCESHHLQERFNSKVKDSDFDFITFLEEFSKIVYTPLLYLVYHGTPDLNVLWNVKKFNACIPLQPSREELADNGVKYLEKVRQLFDDAISTLRLPVGYSVAGLSSENAYLHIQGHQLYKLIRHIGTMLCIGRRVAFTTEILETARHTSGYKEIDKVQSDLRTILSA